MTLLVFVLLVVAALAIAVRVVQSWGMIGVAVLGLVVFGAMVVGGMAGVGWHLSAVVPSISLVRADVADDGDLESARALADEPGDVAPPDTAAKTTTASSDDGVAGDDAIEIETATNGVLIPPRPAWVESDPVLKGDVQTIAVSSGPQEHERDCRRSLDEELKKTVDAYVDNYLGKVYGENFKASTFVNYDLDYIKSHLVRETHQEVIRVSFGPMHQMHALLEFGPEFRAELDSRRGELDEHWKQIVAAGRLTATALGFGFVLALLGVVFGYFKLDTATRGYYTGRLQFASAVVILSLIVAGVLLARHIL